MALIGLIGRAVRYAPMLAPMARKAYRAGKPHLAAYQEARQIDGFVARTTASDGTTAYLVFPARDAAPAVSFPPLGEHERTQLAERLDRSRLAHHSELPEARAMDVATSVRETVTSRRRRR